LGSSECIDVIVLVLVVVLFGWYCMICAKCRVMLVGYCGEVCMLLMVILMMSCGCIGII